MIDGVVAGGKATLEGTGEIEFGGASSASAAVFAANSDAISNLMRHLRSPARSLGQ